MILTCDKCFTRYVVNSDAVYNDGRIVKCIKCGHSWLQKPDKSAPTEEPVPASSTVSASRAPLKAVGISAIPANSRLPVIRVERTPPTPFLLKLLPALLLLLITLLGLVLYKDMVLRTVPELQPLYTIIGLHNTNGIMLREVALSEEEDGLYLYGKLVNTSPQVRTLPALRITTLDSNKRPFASRIFPAQKHIQLEPAAEFPIHNKLPKELNIREAGYITVDTGNEIELLLR